MARFSSERRAAFTRVSRHCLAIAVVAAALVGGSFSRPVSVVQSASETDQPDGRQPALARLDVNGAGAEAGTTETVDARRTQGADQILATVTFDPRLGLPEWLRATHDVPLWSSGDSDASSSVSIPAGTSLAERSLSTRYCTA